KHTRSKRDWSSDVCSSNLEIYLSSRLSHSFLTYILKRKGNWKNAKCLSGILLCLYLCLDFYSYHSSARLVTIPLPSSVKHSVYCRKTLGKASMNLVAHLALLIYWAWPWQASACPLTSKCSASLDRTS